jgi:hypothetical protein
MAYTRKTKRAPRRKKKESHVWYAVFTDDTFSVMDSKYQSYTVAKDRKFEIHGSIKVGYLDAEGNFKSI